MKMAKTTNLEYKLMTLMIKKKKMT